MHAEFSFYGQGDDLLKKKGTRKKKRLKYKRLIRHSKYHEAVTDGLMVSVLDCKIECHWFESQMEEFCHCPYFSSTTIE